MSEDREYVALITGPYGSGSWARGKDKEEQIRRACRIFTSDWKSLFQLKKGGKYKVNVYDVTDYDTVWFDGAGAYSGDTALPLLETVERGKTGR